MPVVQAERMLQKAVADYASRLNIERWQVVATLLYDDSYELVTGYRLAWDSVNGMLNSETHSVR